MRPSGPFIVAHRSAEIGGGVMPGTSGLFVLLRTVINCAIHGLLLIEVHQNEALEMRVNCVGSSTEEQVLNKNVMSCIRCELKQ